MAVSAKPASASASSGSSDWVSQCHLYWGTPPEVLDVQHRGLWTIALLGALLLHSLPMGYLWQRDHHLPEVEKITLQNVDLIDLQPELPPPPPQVEQPKSALDFLKMALPKLEPAKPVEPPPAPIDLEKKAEPPPPPPEIKLQPAPEASHVAELPSIAAQKQAQVAQDPQIKLEEVGRIAAPPPPPIASAIQLNRKAEPVAADAPRIQSMAPAGAVAASERIVDRGVPPSASRPPSLPMGYAPRGSAINLDRARDVRAAAKPTVQSVVPQEQNVPVRPATVSNKKVEIVGQLSSRKVLKSAVPEYPPWARAQGIEADVAIRFFVSSSGEVRERMIVERTSGHPELDQLAIAALKFWRFSTLPGDDKDQWGVITFRYRLD